MDEPTIEAVRDLCTKYGLRYRADLMQWLANNLAELDELRDEIDEFREAPCGECMAKDGQIEGLEADIDELRSRLAKPE
jgi:hypothetical protein